VYWIPVSPIDFQAVATYSAALLAILPVLLGLHTKQAGRSGRLGAWGFSAAFGGAAAAGVGNLLEDGFRLGLIGLLLYLPGILVFTVGLVLLGIATARANVLPRWYGRALLGGVFGLVFIERGGGFLLGLLWLGLGYGLLSEKGRKVSTPRGSTLPFP
jgi:hypothetical protein